MSADDQHYLSWMTRAALAVLMVVVMFWIRSQIPDDMSPGDALPAQSTAAHTTVNSNDPSPAGEAIASAYTTASGATIVR